MTLCLVLGALLLAVVAHVGPTGPAAVDNKHDVVENASYRSSAQDVSTATTDLPALKTYHRTHPGHEHELYGDVSSTYRECAVGADAHEVLGE